MTIPSDQADVGIRPEDRVALEAVDGGIKNPLQSQGSGRTAQSRPRLETRGLWRDSPEVLAEWGDRSKGCRGLSMEVSVGTCSRGSTLEPIDDRRQCVYAVAAPTPTYRPGSA